MTGKGVRIPALRPIIICLPADIYQVMISFHLQLALTWLFWLCGLFDLAILPFVLSALSRAYKPLLLSKWLTKHNQAFVWTQLALTLYIVLAAIVRYQQPDERLFVFEGASINGSLCLTACATALAIISYHPMRVSNNGNDTSAETFGRKGPLFVFTCAAISIIGTITVAISLWSSETENLVGLCRQYAIDNDRPWKDGALLPMRDDRAGLIGPLIGVLLASAIGLACWYQLRWSRRAETRSVQGSLLLTLVLVSGALGYMGIDAMVQIQWNKTSGK